MFRNVYVLCSYATMYQCITTNKGLIGLDFDPYIYVIQLKEALCNKSVCLPALYMLRSYSVILLILREGGHNWCMQRIQNNNLLMWNKNKQALQIKISKLNAGQRDFLLTFEA